MFRDSFVRALALIAFVFVIGGCSLFEPGPGGEPSPFQAGFKAGVEAAPGGAITGHPLIDLIISAGTGLSVGGAAAVQQARKNKKLRAAAKN